MRKLSLKFIVATSLVFSISALVSFIVEYKNFEGGLTYEFCHYNEIARNINDGKGFKTTIFFPSTLALLKERNINFQEFAPVIDRFPIHAYMTAAAQKFLGGNDEAQLMLSLLYLALFAVFTFVVAYRFWGLESGFFCGLAIALCPSFQRGFLLWGLPDFLFALLVFIFVLHFSFLAANGKKSPLHWLLSGATGGVAWLCRANFILWMPLFLLWIFLLKNPKGREKAANAFFFLLGFVLLAFPLMFCNLNRAGSINPPTFAWNLSYLITTNNLPWLEYKTFSSLAPLQYPLSLLKKWLFFFAGNIKAWPFMWQFYLIWPTALFGIAKLWKKQKENPHLSIFIFLFASMLILQVFTFSFLRFETLGKMVSGRYYIWFAPAAVFLSAYWATGLKPATRRVFFVINFLIFSWWLLKPQGVKAYPGGLYVDKWPEIKAVDGYLPKNGFIVSNIPAQIAWYKKRKTIQLPARPSDLVKMASDRKISGIIITRLLVGELYNMPRWKEMLENERFLNKFADNLNFQVKDIGTSVILHNNVRAPRRN